MKKAKFAGDNSSKLYDGITDGRNWNGWAIPLFSKEVVNKIIASIGSRETVFESNGDFYYWDGENLKFDYYTDGEIEVSEIVTPIEFEGVKYWNVGEGWTWSEINLFNKELEEYLTNNEAIEVLIEECEDRDGNDIYRIGITTIIDGEYYVEYFEYYDKDEAENDFMLIEII